MSGCCVLATRASADSSAQAVSSAPLSTLLRHAGWSYVVPCFLWASVYLFQARRNLWSNTPPPVLRGDGWCFQSASPRGSLFSLFPQGPWVAYWGRTHAAPGFAVLGATSRFSGDKPWPWIIHWAWKVPLSDLESEPGSVKRAPPGSSCAFPEEN